MRFTRRQFLKTSLAASAAGAFPGIWQRALQALEPCESGVNLIIVQLEGGNDGINMVIPMTDGSGSNRSTYDVVRPYIGVPFGELGPTQIGNDPGTGGQLALHPHMVGLKALYDLGNVAVIVGVHYPNKNMSHDSSENVWYRADPTLSASGTGWMGRTLDQLCTAQPTAVPAVDMQDELTPLFYGNTSVLAFDDLGSLDFPLTGNLKTRFTNIAGTASASGANYIKNLGTAAYAAVTRIDSYQDADTGLATNLNDIIDGTANGAGFGVSGYPQSYTLARGLRDVYALMRGGPPGTPLGCRVFRVRIGGFDNHSEQGLHIPLATKSIIQKVQSDTGQNGSLFRKQEYHGRLMHRVSNAISAFWQDCKNANLHRNTLIMTFSEFGRSVTENGDHDADSGTDHSTAAPLFIIGPTAADAAPGVPHVNGGAVYGAYQNITTLDPTGDPVFELDFRHVYGEIINKWFGLSAGTTDTILGGGFSYSPEGFLT